MNSTRDEQAADHGYVTLTAPAAHQSYGLARAMYGRSRYRSSTSTGGGRTRGAWDVNGIRVRQSMSKEAYDLLVCDLHIEVFTHDVIDGSVTV